MEKRLLKVESVKVAVIDTNVLIRYLTNDEPQKAKAVESLLNKASDGELRILIPSIVIAELVWVLESYYRMKAEGATEWAGSAGDHVDRTRPAFRLRVKEVAVQCALVDKVLAALEQFIVRPSNLAQIMHLGARRRLHNVAVTVPENNAVDFMQVF